MKKIYKLIGVILVSCLLLTGCNAVNNDSRESTSLETTTQLTEDQLMIIEYQRDNFIQFIVNNEYQGADEYWNDSIEMHFDEEASKYYNYNYGMLNFENGVYATAYDYLSKNSSDFLDTADRLHQFDLLIGIFNGIYTTPSLNGTYLAINNGHVDFIYSIENVSDPIFYSRTLKGIKDTNDKIEFSIGYDSEYDETYKITINNNECTSITLKSDGKSENTHFEGTYTKIQDTVPPIKTV